MASSRMRRAATTSAQLIIAGSAPTAGIETFDAFERIINESLVEWARPLEFIVVPDSLDEVTLDMTNCYARLYRRQVHRVRGAYADYGRAALSIRDRRIMELGTHAVIFAAQASTDTAGIYQRVVRNAVPFVKFD